MENIQRKTLKISLRPQASKDILPLVSVETDSYPYEEEKRDDFLMGNNGCGFFPSAPPKDDLAVIQAASQAVMTGTHH